MSFAQSFVALFSRSDILVICLWVTGFVLFAVEYFQPMRGLAYALGVILLAAAFTIRMLYGSPGEAFVFVFLTTVLMFCVHIVALGTQKRDWLRVSRMERARGARKYGSLVGSIGTANTAIDTVGNVTIGDLNLMVYSDRAIARGEKVRVTSVTKDKIIVESVNDESETSNNE